MTHETRDRARPLDAGFFMRVKAYYITGWDITEWVVVVVKASSRP